VTPERASEILRLASDVDLETSPDTKAETLYVEAQKMGANALLAVSRLEAEREELVEALEKAQMKMTPNFSGRTPYFPSESGRIEILDVLVKHNRVTKNGDRYEWKKP
jgi:hypothetical protein